MEERIITVTGSGGVHIEPDVTRVSLQLESIHDNYNEAYAQGKDNACKLTAIMNELGLDKSLPKTIFFDIDKKTRAEYDKYKNYIGEKFIGFELDHRVKIDLGMDRILLGKLIKLIGHQLKQAEINIGYTVKNPRPSQLKMLERAVKDAREKATIMAQALGCTLAGVKNIDYTEHKLEIYCQTRQIRGADEACSCATESLDITPEDLAVEDHVKVEWFLTERCE